jgi:catechol 2,3-dioxygenase-like lactoylglutathione lyase family enzyme
MSGFRMSEEILCRHVAIECSGQQSADRFFTTILGLPKVKSTTLSKELSYGIFGIDGTVPIEVYDNGKIRFEVFIHKTKHEPSFDHVCIEVRNKSEFIERCEHNGLSPFFVEKEGKQILFVRDFSKNLYEIQ